MVLSRLDLHAGGHEVSREELSLVQAPEPTDTWFPLKHSDVLDSVWTTMEGAGFAVTAHALSVSHFGDRFFATLDLDSRIERTAVGYTRPNKCGQNASPDRAPQPEHVPISRQIFNHQDPRHSQCERRQCQRTQKTPS